MGKGIESGNVRIIGINEGPEAGSAETGTTVEIVNDTAAASGSEKGTGSAAGEKRKSARKSREIPVLITPAEIAAPEPPEKVKKPRAVKADPIISAAIIAIAGSGMMTAGKMLGEEKLWTPTTAELTSVAEPAARIIERLNATATVSKYADYIALGVAIATIVIPRIMATTAKKPKGVSKPHGKKGNTSPYPTNPEATPVQSTGIEAGKEIPEINPADAQTDVGISQINLGYDESI